MFTHWLERIRDRVHGRMRQAPLRLLTRSMMWILARSLCSIQSKSC